MSTQDFREQTAFSRHFLSGKSNSSNSPLVYHQFQQTLALPSRRKPCTEDQSNDPTTYCRHLSPGAICALVKDFLACPKQNAKVAFHKTLRNSQRSSALVSSCLPIFHNEGCSEAFLGRWVSLKRSDKQVLTQHVAMTGISKGGGVCCGCSQWHLTELVTSCLSCHLEMRGWDVKRDPLNTNTTTQKQQFKVPQLPS